jgi:ATP-dependent helicase HepA
MSRRRGLNVDDQDEEMPRNIGLPRIAAKKPDNEIVVIGQRWASEMEPELGQGKIIEVDRRRLTVSFHDGATKRTYTRENAPVRRVKFKAGDQIRTVDNRSHNVISVREENSLLIYHTADDDICETELSGSIGVAEPFERLLSARTGSSRDFALRLRVLDIKEKIAGSPLRGFAGGKIELIPHQLYIANEVTSRHVRRVMLADEVGLGKTIEACLILHRLFVCGRAEQVLIIVPDSLVNVWFVELLRKFNLLFRIFDQDYFESSQLEDNTNPFLEESLVLCGIGLFSNITGLSQKAAEVKWDMLIVDEAHHLREGTDEFDIIDKLSKVSRDLLLLTATPQQHGGKNHFARLRMLDPSRYTDYESFVNETKMHKRIADITGKLLDGEEISEKDALTLNELLESGSENVSKDLKISDKTARTEIIAELLDRFGIGRAMFRNTRSVIGGFPSREVYIIDFEGSKTCIENIKTIFFEDMERKLVQKRKLQDDPRVEFISDLLKKTGEEKILVICRSKDTVFALDEALKKLINVNTAMFHEDLTLIQRDRNAAWFSEDDGARILLCSEIGSEGRNFQFVHHLVLFDFPCDPELVEQRIGRLDRIGQKGPIKIYVPYVKNTPDGLLAQWFDEGMDIFSSVTPGAQEVYDRFSIELKEFISSADRGKQLEESWKRFISKTKDFTSEVMENMKAGRDRLLEQHSFRPAEASRLVESIRELDKEKSVKEVMEKLFVSRGIIVEGFSDHIWKLWSEAQLDETFPGLRSTRPVVTFDRTTAIHREDMEFLSIDHPAVYGGVDLFLSSETGNAALALWKKGPKRELLLDTVFIAECIAPPDLYIDRFIPPLIIRVIINHERIDRSVLAGSAMDLEIEETVRMPALENNEIKSRLLPSMLKEAQSIASERCVTIVNGAVEKIRVVIGKEIERLINLKKCNSSITGREIEMANKELSDLLNASVNTVPRLDAVRLIWSTGKDQA